MSGSRHASRCCSARTAKSTACATTGCSTRCTRPSRCRALAKPGQLATSAQLAPLAKTNVDSLKEFDYFTFAKSDGHKVVFAPPVDYTLEEREDKRVVLHFTLPLATPLKPGRYLSLQVYDPTYFVDFELAPKDPVQLAGAPPGCSKSVLAPIRSSSRTARRWRRPSTPA